MMSDSDGRTGLTRRESLVAAGIASAGLIVVPALGFPGIGAAPALAAALTLTPEQEQGPYYVALDKVRSDIVDGQAGVPLRFQVTVLNATTGRAIKGAAVDLWQCSPLGIHSDESSENTTGQSFLRGVQLTDDKGLAQFITVYPGHYAGRAVHIHAKVHVAGKVTGTAYSGGHVSHTGQMFLSDTISDEIFKLSPYSRDTTARVLNAADRVYTQQGGAKSVIRLTRRAGALATHGLLGRISLAVNPASTPAVFGAGGGGGAGG